MSSLSGITLPELIGTKLANHLARLGRAEDPRILKRALA